MIRCSETACERAEDLFERHLGLLRPMVFQICAGLNLPRSVDRENLYSVALIALWKEAQKFDSTRGFVFWTPAVIRVRGAILDELRRVDIMSRRIRHLYKEACAKRNSMECETGRSDIEIREACIALGFTKAQTSDVVTFSSIKQVPLQAPVSDAPGEDSQEVSETVADPNSEHPFDRVAQEEDIVRLRQCLGELPSQMRFFTEAYLFKGIPQCELAVMSGLTRQGVSVSIRKGTKKLRELLLKKPL